MGKTVGGIAEAVYAIPLVRTSQIIGLLPDTDQLLPDTYQLPSSLRRIHDHEHRMELAAGLILDYRRLPYVQPAYRIMSLERS